MRIEIVGGLLLLGTSFMHAADPRWNAFRTSQVALVAGSAADAWTSYGGRELNPVLGRGTFGAKQVAMKVGLTAALVAVEEPIVRRRPALRRAFTVGNWIAAGVLGGVAARNTAIK